MLKASGLPADVTDRIRDIVNTCRECRMWAAAGNATVSSISLPMKFNEKVEGDLLFYKAVVIMHLICRCTRWHAGQVIENKTEQVLLDSIHSIWIAVFGPMQELYFDGESGLTTDYAKAHLKRLGVDLKIRAPGQHAQYAERHGALLRIVMHLTEDQCKREGIPITMKMLVTQSLFVLNAMTTVGDSSPYNAVLGRQPAILPPLADSTTADGAGDSADGRREARIREIAINSMTQASAMARVNRASSARTTSSTQGKYQPGDLVDYWRKLEGKDTSPWHGPVPVIRDSPSERHPQAWRWT